MPDQPGQQMISSQPGVVQPEQMMIRERPPPVLVSHKKEKGCNRCLCIGLIIGGVVLLLLLLIVVALVFIGGAVSKMYSNNFKERTVTEGTSSKTTLDLEMYTEANEYLIMKFIL